MDSVEVKAGDLIGAALDWAVAISEGWESDRPQDGQLKRKWLGVDLYVVAGSNTYAHPANRYSPSTDWNQCGPLIEKHNVSIDVQFRSGRWDAFCSGWVNNCETPMIAACIAIVKAKLGETVSIPAELLK
jgi:hypothetical protein